LFLSLNGMGALPFFVGGGYRGGGVYFGGK
jgi:hypothetical protein